jgi:4-amino-4-deoxy-L-arabinose transferase-like glycosyltransferase
MDTTEARYSEISRIISETNNWITLQIDYGVPFWAKPPLSSWLSASSFNILGVNEFAARFPYLLLSIGIILMLGKYARKQHLPFYLPGFILLTIPEFYLHAGVVSTDTALTFSVVLCMLSFWESLQNPNKTIWNYLFFVGIGLGLLAKGPIVIILTIPPIVVWIIFFKEYRNTFKSFPWILGSFIVAIIALPWYYLAEKESPGFFDYFVIGEHFSRFFDSSWKGDKYGFPKVQPLGIVWVFLLLFAIPWIQVLILKTWKNRFEILKNKWLTFLFLWLLWTPVFFTISKSLIHTYIMPVIIPIALLITYWWNTIKKKELLVSFCLLVPLLLIIAYGAIKISSKEEFYTNSDKFLIEHHLNKETEIYYFEIKSYSGQFYAKGKVKKIDTEEIIQKIKNKTPFKLIVLDRILVKNQFLQNLNLELIESNFKTGVYYYSGK